ncbi:MAG: hypothetical protein IMZ43_08780 [Thermoplasmata archaeon]|nr:hypothetical protein [Thermoplasmata archaeon]
MNRPSLIFTKEFKEAVVEAKELNEIGNILTTDLKRVIEISDEKIEQYKDRPEPQFLNEQETWIRLSIRLLFTTIEAVCFKLKQFALIGHQIRNMPLDAEDRMNLNEKRENGSPYFMPTAVNLKYAFKMAAASVDKTYKIEFELEWDIFLRLLKKRNDLTHPKKTGDLAVSVKNQSDAADTGLWFGKILNGLTKTIMGL